MVTQSLPSMENRSKAGLKIDHAIPAEVFHLFISHSLERLFGLHNSDCVCKAFQVLWQASLVGPLVEPACQLFRIFSRKLVVV